MELSAITCRSINADWIKGPGNPQLKNAYHIWSVQVSNSAPVLGDLKSILLPDEIAKSEQFHFEKDRNNYIVRRASLRILLSRYLVVPPKAIDFTTGVNKRPILKSIHEPRLAFNVSHSGEMILIAISDLDIGVDIEEVSPGFNYTEILESSFSGQEKRYIEKAGKPLFAFYDIWTRKEALLKACSKGISDDLAEYQCLDGAQFISKDLLDNSWFVKSFNIKGLYAASVALMNDSVPNFYELSLA